MYVRTYVPGNQFNLKLDLLLAYYCTWLQIYILCLHPSTGPLPLIKSINWTPPLYFTLQLYPSLLLHPSIGTLPLRPSIRPLPFITPFNWTPPPAGLQELSVWEDCRSPSNPHLLHLPRVYHCCWIEVLLPCADLPVFLSRRCVHAYVMWHMKCGSIHTDTYVCAYMYTYVRTYVHTFYVHMYNWQGCRISNLLHAECQWHPHFAIVCKVHLYSGRHRT